MLERHTMARREEHPHRVILISPTPERKKQAKPRLEHGTLENPPALLRDPNEPWICLKCGWNWFGRNRSLRPERCPNCHRRSWDKPPKDIHVQPVRHVQEDSTPPNYSPQQQQVNPTCTPLTACTQTVNQQTKQGTVVSSLMGVFRFFCYRCLGVR